MYIGVTRVTLLTETSRQSLVQPAAGAFLRESHRPELPKVHMWMLPRYSYLKPHFALRGY